MLDSWLESIGKDVHSIGDYMLGRPSEPEEVADVVVWLATDEARAVTGIVIPVNQGRGGH